MALTLPTRQRSLSPVEVALKKSKRRWRGPTQVTQTGGTLDITVLIDKIFAQQVAINEGDAVRRVTCIRAVIHQLWQKSLGGSRKAHRLYMRYIRFVAGQVRGGGLELRFGPDMLTAEEVQRKHGRTQ